MSSEPMWTWGAWYARFFRALAADLDEHGGLMVRRNIAAILRDENDLRRVEWATRRMIRELELMLCDIGGRHGG